MKVFKKYSVATVVIIQLVSIPVFAATYSSIDGANDSIADVELKRSSLGLNVLQSLENAKSDKYLKVGALIQSKDYREAHKEVTALLGATPNDMKLYNLQALLYFFQGNKEAAEASYKIVIRNDINNLTANLGLARLFLQADHLNKAKKMAEKALVIDNKSVSASLILADIAIKNGNINEAEKVILKVYSQVKGDINAEIKVLSALGKLYANQQQPEIMLKLARGIASRYPDDYRALSVLAGAQIVNEQNKEAEKTLNRIISLKKNDIDHRLMLAQVISKQAKREREILDLLEQVLNINPEYLKAIVFKNRILIQQNNFQQAMNFAQEIEKKFPKSSLGKQLQGDVFLAEKKPNEALVAYRQSYKIQAVVAVLNRIVSILQYQNKQDEVIKLLHGELDKNINPVEMHLKLATVYSEIGKGNLVKQHYKAVLKLQPQNITALNNLAWFYKEQKQLGDAQIMAKKAYELAPKIPSVADTYAYILLKQGQWKPALGILKIISENSPQNIDIQSHLAEAYLLAGNKKQAVAVMDKFVKNVGSAKDKKAAILYVEELKNK